MEWILFYYNSLPDLPSACPFFSSHLMHRDFLMCNPSNTGHYKYPRFETLSYDDGCHERQVHNFLNRPDPDKYVVFYTRHTNSNGHRANKVIGYFKVGKRTKHPFGFLASESVLLPKDRAISIPYAGRGVPTSWGSANVKQTVNRILRELMALAKCDVSIQYQRETKAVMKMLLSKRGRMKMLDTCKQCPYRTSCYWGSKTVAARKRTLKELYEANKPC
jgi:hypothetical protein